MPSSLLVNTIVSYNSADLTLAASGINGNIALTATGSGFIKCNSPVIASSINNTVTNGSLSLAANGTGTINLNSNVLANTISSPSAANLTLNSSSNQNINIFPGSTGQVQINSKLYVNTLLPYSTNDLTISAKTSVVSANINLESVGSGYVNISNTGLRLPNGGSTLSWYGETSITGVWSYAVNLFTYSLIRIGSQICLFGPNLSGSVPGAATNNNFSINIPLSYRPQNNITHVHYPSGLTYYIYSDGTFQCYTANTITTNYGITIIWSTLASARGAGGSSGGAAIDENGNPIDKPVDNNPLPDTTNL